MRETLSKAQLHGVVVNGETYDGPVYLFFCPACQSVMWFPEDWAKPAEPASGYQPGIDLQRPSVDRRVYTDLGCHFEIEDGYLKFSQASKHELAGHRVQMRPFSWDPNNESPTPKVLATN